MSWRGRENRDTSPRVEGFIDAAFAFAVTLLVSFGTEVPKTSGDLLAALKAVPAFAASAALIGMFWYAHVRWSRRFGEYRDATLYLSLLLVFVVLVFVYPLRVLFTTFFGWVSGGTLGPVATGVDWSRDLALMFLAYAAAFSAMAGCMAALYFVSARRLSPATDPARRRRALMEGTELTVFVAVALLSAALTGVLFAVGATWMWMFPGLVYGLIALAPAVARRVSGQRGHRSTVGEPPGIDDEDGPAPTEGSADPAG